MYYKTSVCGFQVVQKTGKKDFTFVRVCFPVSVPGVTGRFFLTSMLDAGEFGKDGVSIGFPLVVCVDQSMRVVSVSPVDKFVSDLKQEGEALNDG